jgi:hypothetical protein
MPSSYFCPMRWAIVLGLVVGFVLLLQASSCRRKENNCTATRISILGFGSSHNSGQSCQNCHAFQGIGVGCFTTSGTIYRDNGYDFYPDGEIRMYTQPDGQGENRGTLYTDNTGNFYSTRPIDYSGGLYPVLIDGNDKAYYMVSPVDEGNCNRCHGEYEQRIKVD